MVYIIVLLIITNALSIAYIFRSKRTYKVEFDITDQIAKGVSKGMRPLVDHLKNRPIKWIDASGTKIYERRMGERIERRKIKNR